MASDTGDVWAIVLAGGVARRFGRPKQFERVGGIRMVDRTVAAARRTCDRVALVLPPGRAWDGAPVDALAVGGDHQSESLRAGLATVPDSAGIIVAADPAHPLAADALFTRVIEAVRAGADGAVPVVPILEVIQRVCDGRVVGTVPRSDLVITQSPHAFRADVLRTVHMDRPRPVENSGLLVERGYRVDTVPGDPGNLHVTTPEELDLVHRLTRAEVAVRADRPLHTEVTGESDNQRMAGHARPGARTAEGNAS
ncbi:2-C-methyl-D-erythritol 4-phosphate cytidylyltransferase [Pseudonocardia acidicola]|uniref:NTP transferase domain-containing protein n=1 Tax=Pseudonocardia acidicola TaxID=2724939 RepID=A0ABX1SFB2_9PSEU|nr:NTP transferase domain-containing protein [Pseudonocardia acidicola]